MTEPAERYAVSESTIRRGPTRLPESGQLVRTYGGALSQGNGEERALHEREGSAVTQKAAYGS